jgi:hypothetical protein
MADAGRLGTRMGDASMILGLLLAAAVADPAPAGTAPPVNEIVVRGRSLDSLKADLARCIAARCPVRQDVIASVRVGEALFREARYAQSRAVLQEAIRRDRDRAAEDPYAVASLYEATATVAQHDGEQAVQGAATAARVRLLKDQIGADRPATLRAELDRIDFLSGRQPFVVTENSYRSFADRAQAANQPNLAALATLRLAAILARGGEPHNANRLLEGIATSPAPIGSGIRLAAYAVQVRFSRGGARQAAEQSYRAALARLPQTDPVLLSAPPPPLVADVANLTYFDRVDSRTHAEDYLNAQWADISFAVRPDGTVAEPEVLRGTLAGGDAAAILKTIAHRTYAPFDPGEGDRYRLERWTLTADYDTPTGSLVRRRLRFPHYVSLDITTGDKPARPGAG